MVKQDFKNSEADQAYQQVMDAIVTQQLSPSQKVSENIFSDMFGISRTLARNLIERLIAKQFLVTVSPRVTLVAPLTAMEIKQNFALRKILMPQVWALAAASVDHEALEALHAEIRELRPMDNDGVALQMLQQNKALNLMVCANAGYPLMLDWIQQLEDTAMRIYWLYIKANNRSPYSSEQQARVLQALRSDEPASIREAVHDILSQVEDRILTSIFTSAQFLNQDLKL
ncbi:GntR family transcriptional regulator [Kineobactrum salinum]|uniref:GntR family transcriptional regulator n=1 Tax=Kineobactrum salinum TaxID=2708301 RepID=A0A6C0U0D9_9GAMM|nr:GntR family transcriptional regulator [Kineobactrum salinum]QIB65243.1 GntR family transcriptional regulator [Kineobactrum salinum]